MKKAIGVAGSVVDHVGGRLFYGALGVMTFAMTFGAVWLAWKALAAGHTAGGMLSGVFAIVMVCLTRHCWSSERRLTDIDY